ncbi:hypothetical protein G7Y89_g11654 [Cudoniella acicularis]|uniref:Uncharacterized protein n=1 Tax=Cudoniella acicularis TaxID=354080 RepID=A0A8H4VY38_9HELO|nr:hypothetical protein G7Y89_g11654 [Cudoniella acicularis]
MKISWSIFSLAINAASTTITPTVIVTTYSIYGQAKVKRDTNPDAIHQEQFLAKRATSSRTIPAYASPCSGSVRYSSACSCLGITQTTITASVATVTASAVTTTTTIVACSPSNNYGLLYNSGDYGPPPGTKSDGSTFAATPQTCCARCFTTEGCLFFESFDGQCALTVYNNGPITNPNNSECPYGQASFDFVSGNVFGEGPCSGP